MGYIFAVIAVESILMTADEWGGPHWLVMCGQGLYWLIIVGAAIAVLRLIIHGMDGSEAGTPADRTHDKKN